MSGLAGVIGIDLGTTNTVIARDTQVLGSASGLPSVVAFPPNGQVLVGADARRRRLIDPENTIVSAKRLMGRDASSVAIDEFRKRYPLKLILDPARGPAFQTRAGEKTPTEIASILLEQALVRAGVEPSSTRAIVTVPAEFTRPQRQATVEAARLAGIQDAQILDEPIATAVAHFGHEHSGWAAVYDFGGGTFDFAVVDARKWPYRIIAHGGDLFLGGDDLDAAFARAIGNELLRQHGWDVMNEVEAFDRLVAEAEQAKIRLTADAETDVDLNQIDPDTPIASATLRVTRTMLNACIDSLVRRTFITCDTVLRASGVSAREVEHVLLAGGTTLVPAVSNAVANYFGRAPKHELSPFHAVALGAAQHPWRNFG